MEVLSISLGRGILEKGTRERARMALYAARLSSLHMVVLTRKEHGYATPTIEGALHLYPTNSRSRFMMLIDAYRIGRYILKRKKNRDMVVSAQDPLEMGWLAFVLSRVTGTKLQIQVHGDYFNDGWVSGSVLRRVRRMYALLLLKRASLIRVVSERIKKSLVSRGINASCITVLPIRPELEVFLSRERVVREDGYTVFLYVGRLAPEKDLTRMLLAFKEVYQVNPNVRLRMVGKGEEERRLRTLATTLGIEHVITFVPWTEDVAGEMANADVFLLTSKHEAYGLVLVEAMASGLPIVTTDVGCVGEVVKHGVHGVVVHEEGATPFSEGMLHVMGSTQYGERGRETAKMIGKVSEGEYVDAWVNTYSGGCEKV